MIVVLVLRHFLGGARLSLEGSVKRGEREVKLAVAERRRRGMEVILFFWWARTARGTDGGFCLCNGSI